MKRETITRKTCLSCGACCVAPEDTDAFCDVMPEDAARLGNRFVRLHVLQPRMIDALALMLDGDPSALRGAIRTKWRKQKAGPHQGYEILTCAMLDGDVMHRTKCRIYKDRPKVCHNAVKPGDRACRAIRKAFQNQVTAAGLEPAT